MNPLDFRARLQVRELADPCRIVNAEDNLKSLLSADCFRGCWCDECQNFTRPADLSAFTAITRNMLSSTLLFVPFAVVQVCGMTSLLADPGLTDAGVYVDPVHFNHTLLGPVGNAAHPRWYLAEWNNPSHLNLASTPGTASICMDPGYNALRQPSSWTLSSASASGPSDPSSPETVCRLSSGNYVLRQNGSSISCGPELDLFVSPTGSNYPAFPQGFIGPSPPLSNLTTLRATFTFGMLQSVTEARCGSFPQCGGGGHVDYGYGVLGVIFDNYEAGQTIFY